MAYFGRSLLAAGKGFSAWLGKYLAWLLLTALVTLGGSLLLMVFKDWTIGSLVTSMMVWPLLGIAMLVAVPMALLPVGRIYLFSAVGGGLLYNLILLIA